jgi:predicted dinucleotide-binding enzyme
MRYSIVEFGNIRQGLSEAFARNGIEVSVATTRDPKSFAADAAAIGPMIMPQKLADAAKADIIFLAVCSGSRQDVAMASDLQGLGQVRLMNTACPPAGPRCTDRIEHDPIRTKWRKPHEH